MPSYHLRTKHGIRTKPQAGAEQGLMARLRGSKTIGGAQEGMELSTPIDFVAGRMSLPAVPRRLQDVGDEALDAAAVVADRLGVCFERDRIAGCTADTIVDWADAVDADLIVVGERPRSLKIGTTMARWVARNSTRPVLVARPAVRERVAA